MSATTFPYTWNGMMVIPPTPESGCRHWLGTAYCGRAPTRRYMTGQWCLDHCPDKESRLPCADCARLQWRYDPSWHCHLHSEIAALDGRMP